MNELLHLRLPLQDLGCDMCDEGLMRICFENPLTNPVHVYGADLFKCGVPDSVYENEPRQ